MQKALLLEWGFFLFFSGFMALSSRANGEMPIACTNVQYDCSMINTQTGKKIIISNYNLGTVNGNVRVLADGLVSSCRINECEPISTQDNIPQQQLGFTIAVKNCDNLNTVLQQLPTGTTSWPCIAPAPVTATIHTVPAGIQLMMRSVSPVMWNNGWQNATNPVSDGSSFKIAPGGELDFYVPFLGSYSFQYTTTLVKGGATPSYANNPQQVFAPSSDFDITFYMIQAPCDGQLRSCIKALGKTCFNDCINCRIQSGLSVPGNCQMGPAVTP